MLNWETHAPPHCITAVNHVTSSFASKAEDTAAARKTQNSIWEAISDATTTAIKGFPNCSLDAPPVVVDGVELLEVATGEVVGMLGRLEALEDKPVVAGLLDELVTVA